MNNAYKFLSNKHVANIKVVLVCMAQNNGQSMDNVWPR